MIFLIGSTVLYYKKILTVTAGKNKKIEMMKRVLGVIVLFGLVSTFSGIQTMSGKVVILVALALLINFYNINYSTSKCNYPDLYKFNLLGRSSIIIIAIMLFIWYSVDRDIFSFLYSDIDTDSTTTTDILDKITFYTADTSDCPDPTSDKWKDLSKDEKEKCKDADRDKLDKRRRKEITDKVYA